jgi:hypothetical protein
MFGLNAEDHPSFLGTIWDYWLQASEQRWTNHSDVVPGYYLLSLTGFYGGLDWSEQNERIREDFGLSFSRASDHLIAEAFFSSSLLYRKMQKKTEFFWPWADFFAQWGTSTDTLGRKPAVHLSYNGIRLKPYYPHTRGLSYLAAAVAQHLPAPKA